MQYRLGKTCLPMHRMYTCAGIIIVVTHSQMKGCNVISRALASGSITETMFDNGMVTTDH